MRRWVAFILALLLAAPGAAQGVRVKDGDTIEIDRVSYRLWGIDTAETHQLCADDWPAGQVATIYLRELIRGDHAVVCEPKAKDRYGRVVAICRLDGVDLGAALVRAGMAWAFLQYSHDYVAQEAAARAEKLGVHDHACEKPWDWRAAQRSPKPANPKSGP